MGIRLLKSNIKMIEENINPITDYIEHWCQVSANYRIVAVKMVLLPKLIFIFLNASLASSIKVLNKIQALINLCGAIRKQE